MKVTVRQATAEDHLLYLRLLPELGVDDPPPDGARFVSELLPTMLVAEIGGEAVGLCTWLKFEGSGHVRSLIVDPRARRSGVGRALLEVVAGKLRDAGCSTWTLNVKPENVGAVGLYTSMGFRRDYASVAMSLSWAAVPALPQSPPVQARAVTPEDDRALERLFSLPAGQVENRRRSKRVLLTLVDGAGELVALSAYDPSNPNANPFRVKEPSLARALLEAMHAHALPGAESTGVVVANDEALFALLQTNGASVRMHIDHYAGSVPSPLRGRGSG